MAYPAYTDTYKTDLKVGDKTINIEIGKFSEQVAAAVLLRCGDTIVHTTVALGRKVNLGYFPLSVEFAEKLYASGIIKGSRWVKRDGRPTDEAILKARVIDRSMRPLFPDGLTNEVQVVNTVFSYDKENDPDMLGLLGTAIGLQISEIPFEGPIAGLRVGFSKEDGKFVINPTWEDRENQDLDLIVSGSGDSIVMVEAGAKEVAEQVVVDALVKAQEELGKVCKQVDKIVKDCGRDKVELIEAEDAAKAEANETLAEQLVADNAKTIRQFVEAKGKLESYDDSSFVEETLAKLNQGKDEDSEDLVTESQVKSALSKAMKKIARQMILDEGMRPDGRKQDEVRQIWVEVDVFPRTHGSAMFKRGATQAVTITTLGSPSLGQHIEDMEGEEVRHYMHFYNMPPYASGEAGRFGYPKRREIGHGALAERALQPMIPDQEDFPYAIHVVSEILSSNGSTSQASVCGSTLSLMAAGVPIKRPVAGIAMGLMSDGKKHVVLSDIQGLEDHVGDMDFKVAGTSEGITAIQMDIKLTGLTRKILEEALEQARAGRQHIMDSMLKVLAEPREQLSEYAPKIEQITIPGDRIGELIGPGGKVIKNIIEVSGAEVDVDEDKDKEVGLVNISSPDQEKIDAARTMIENMMRVVEIGDEFDGPVTRIEDFGAFVEYLPGREGLVHVSNMSTDFVDDPRKMVEMGQEVHVRVAEIKDDGKIGLSMLSEEEEAEAKSQSAGRPPFKGGRPSGGNVRRRNQNKGYEGGRGRRNRHDDNRGGRGGRSNDRNSNRGGRNDRNDRNNRNDRGNRNNRGRNDDRGGNRSSGDTNHGSGQKYY